MAFTVVNDAGKTLRWYGPPSAYKDSELIFNQFFKGEGSNIDECLRKVDEYKALTQARDTQIQTPVVYDNHAYAVDLPSLTRMLAALATLSDQETVEWIALSNESVHLNSFDLRSILRLSSEQATTTVVNTRALKNALLQ